MKKTLWIFKYPRGSFRFDVSASTKILFESKKDILEFKRRFFDGRNYWKDCKPVRVRVTIEEIK